MARFRIRGARPRTAVAVLAGLLTLLALSGDVASAQTVPAQTVPARTGSGPTIPSDLPDLPEVARVNEKTLDEVRRILADATARVDADQADLLRRPPAAGALGGDAPQAGPFPYAQTFTLHSRAGSQRTIYLDFNGETIQNTAWNGFDGAPAGPYLAEAFSIDGSTAFSNAEQDVIQSVWQRVSEDYAPFDVDVTTQDPGAAAITRSGAADQVYGTRALITNATEIADTCGCGGIAYVGTFDNSSQPRLLPAGLIFAAEQFYDAKNIAEARRHEVGHNLGLSHDGTGSGEYSRGPGLVGADHGRRLQQADHPVEQGRVRGRQQHRVRPRRHAANGATSWPTTTANTRPPPPPSARGRPSPPAA